jgi:hypothetical protein
MRIDEVFDSSYKLIPAKENISSIVKDALKNDGFNSIMVYEAEEDPNQIFILASIDGAWEVHHSFAEPGKNFISGKILTGDRVANPKFFGTAIRLYQSRLDKAQSIRVVSFENMWDTYSKVIKRMTNNPRYEAGEVKKIPRNGDVMISQEVHPTNKFEGLKNKNVSL